ncbi:MAG: phosphoribosylglycinamide formyltransferase [Actinobacteria bacterium]|nr:phosphoribosylglycinamide formyltransferase [Actinomycetota bacterium]
MSARVAVLASGGGTNLQALLDAPEVKPWISLVVSDRPRAGALERARMACVEAVVLEPGGFATREEHDRALAETLRNSGIDVLLLAGYMRILGAPLVRSFPERILNVHPSLLPAFPGASAVRDALDWGAKVTGATVHMVDEEVDHGPIVLQEAIPILPGDDEAGLHARIQAVEHRLFPLGARLLVEGRLKVEGRRVHILGPGSDGDPGSAGTR